MCPEVDLDTPGHTLCPGVSRSTSGYDFGKRAVLEFMSARRFTDRHASRECTRRSFVRLVDFSVGSDRQTTSNPVPQARWPRHAAVLRPGSREANRKDQQGRSRRPAHTLPDTPSATAVSLNPTTSAWPATTASVR